ncbi:MAG TPA: AIR synthase related protein, partial [Gammaproteobacteria bacterium]|nr:AIR synthase related protein [Gammaproteobacteria bacterium]
MLNEQFIIERFQHDFKDLPFNTVGIGDDAAIIPIDQDECYVVTKDLLIEDIHFRLHYFDAYSIAHKTLHANMSDIAAMGASPQYAILGL